MTELPKEWQKKAYKTTFYGTSYLQGATAYKQAVEAKAKEYIYFYVRMADNDAVSILNAFLTELQTLKPTSND
jgi:hypothetical protein